MARTNILRSLYAFLERSSQRSIVMIGILFLVVLGVIDVSTGYELSFSIFYLLPIVIVSYFGTRPLGVIMSFLSAAVWLYADIVSGHVYAHPAIPAWNAVMRLGFFLVITYYTAENRRLLRMEQELARTDGLTGVASSRAIRIAIDKELLRSSRTGRPVTLVYLDIDNFKLVNDTQGHGAGDQLLVAAAETIRGSIRDIDTAGRIGGDEYVIVLPETGEREAIVVAVRLKERLLGRMRAGGWPVTFSFGVMTCDGTPCTVDDLIKDADDLMYRSKTGGKNRITADLRGAEAAVVVGGPCREDRSGSSARTAGK
jgi:diguanylate cyclase (GGDEF)-like protein